MSTTPTQAKQQAQANAKPTLQGVRIKTRKGVARAQAKHEPTVFRAELFKVLDSVPAGSFDGYAAVLNTAGDDLEYRKYADQLFELLIVGGLLVPGGGFLEDGTPPCPFSILGTPDPASVEIIKKHVEVLNKLIRRHKYLQKLLEESALTGILQYTNKWTPVQREKLAITTGLMISQGLVNTGVLQIFIKEHLVKDGTSIAFVTLAFRTFLAEQPIEYLAGNLNRSGVKDLINFFPLAKRDTPKETIDEHFKGQGLPQVAEWYSKRQATAVREQAVNQLQEMREDGATSEAIISFLKEHQDAAAISEAELVQVVWGGLMKNVKPDQIKGSLKENASIFEAFATPRFQSALINFAQQYVYENHVMKLFPYILQDFYNEDVLSSEAIFFWAKKGPKQGREILLQATAPLIKRLEEMERQHDSEDSEDDGE